ncbi:MAG: TVP38/TMEM64 family protein [Promethearchaeota archaeon]
MEEENKKVPFKAKFKDYIKNLFNFSQYNTKTKIYIFIFMALVVLSLILLGYIIFIDDTILYRVVVEWFANPIHLLGFWGIFFFLAVMAIQGLIVPLPSEIVLFATGMIWGWVVGGFMNIIGSVAAGILCFYMSRKGGRPLAERFVGEKGLDLVDEYISKNGIKAIIILRSIPVVPFDVISYASGLIDLDVKTYTIGTFIGSIFRAFFWSIFGSILFLDYGLSFPLDLATLPIEFIKEQAFFLNMILLVIFIVIGGMFFVYYLQVKRLEKKKELKNN